MELISACRVCISELSRRGRSLLTHRYLSFNFQSFNTRSDTALQACRGQHSRSAKRSHPFVTLHRSHRQSPPTLGTRHQHSQLFECQPHIPTSYRRLGGECCAPVAAAVRKVGRASAGLCYTLRHTETAICLLAYKHPPESGSYILYTPATTTWWPLLFFGRRGHWSAKI
jgi:hypothetical protein